MKKIGGGARKIGRNKESCAEYRKGHRREKNKIKKWKKMLKKLQDNSDTAIDLKNRIRRLEEEVIK